MSRQKAKYDIRETLNIYMPHVLELIGEQRISWNSINSGLEKHLIKKRNELLESGENEILKDTTFYSFLLGNVNGNPNTAAMFDFFSKTFSQLKERLAETELKHLHKIVKLVLTNFDYKYLNFIGELATLNAYKSTDEYNLLNIEERIYDHNNVQADLFLRRKLDNKEFLVEIVNIHIENRQLNKKVQIEKFVNGKINEKVEKTFFDNPKQELFLQPVIWIESFEQIKILAKIFRKRNRKNIFIPMCYLTYKNRDGTFEHRFEYVNTILTEEF